MFYEKTTSVLQPFGHLLMSDIYIYVSVGQSVKDSLVSWEKGSCMQGNSVISTLRSIELYNVLYDVLHNVYFVALLGMRSDCSKSNVISNNYCKGW